MLWQPLLVVKRLLLGCTVWPKKNPYPLFYFWFLWYLWCYFYTLIITFITFFYYLIIAQCIRQVKEYESVWNEIIGSRDHHFSKMFPILTDCFWTSCWTAGSADHFGWDYGCQSHSEGTLEAIQEVTFLVCHFIQLVGQSVGQWNLSQRVSQSVSQLLVQSVI